MGKKKSFLTKLLTLLLLIVLAFPANVDAASKTKMNASKKTVNVGKTCTVKLLNNKKKVKWSTSNKNIKIVSKNKKQAKIKGIKKGTSYLRVKVGKKTYKCKISVKKAPTSKPTPKPTPTPTPTPTPKPPVQPVKTYAIGETWTVDGQWKVTVNSVEETTDRNPYSEKNPAAVYLVTYTYENIGYIEEYSDGLFMSLEDTIVDSAGKMGYSYPGDKALYAQETPVGATCEAQACIGVDNAGSFKIHVTQYDGNEKRQSAIFSIDL